MNFMFIIQVIGLILFSSVWLLRWRHLLSLYIIVENFVTVCRITERDY